MDGPQLSFAFPKPGRALKLVLLVILVLGILHAFLANWVPQVGEVFRFLACELDKVQSWQLWRLLTSGLLTSPDSYSHLVFTLLGLYFLAPDLERRWGARRFLLFLAYAVVAGNLAVLLVDRITPPDAQP